MLGLGTANVPFNFVPPLVRYLIPGRYLVSHEAEFRSPQWLPRDTAVPRRTWHSGRNRRILPAWICRLYCQCRPAFLQSIGNLCFALVPIPAPPLNSDTPNGKLSKKFLGWWKMSNVWSADHSLLIGVHAEPPVALFGPRFCLHPRMANSTWR